MCEGKTPLIIRLGSGGMLGLGVLVQRENGLRALGDAPNKMLGESLWRWWSRRTDARLNREELWDMVEPYKHPKSLTPLLLINIAAFYSGVVAAAVIEHVHKDRYWVEHPGQAIPIMKPMFYIGP